jgi:ferredoxin-NADP reductase
LPSRTSGVDPTTGRDGDQPVVSTNVLNLPEPYDEHEYFICGPDVMMDAIERALGALHVPKPKYHSERCSFV